MPLTTTLTKDLRETYITSFTHVILIIEQETLISKYFTLGLHKYDGLNINVINPLSCKKCDM